MRKKNTSTLIAETHCSKRRIVLPVHLLVLRQDEIVAGEGHAEDDGRHALEAVDPLLALRSLPTHVKHPKRQA